MQRTESHIIRMYERVVGFLGSIFFNEASDQVDHTDLLAADPEFQRMKKEARESLERIERGEVEILSQEEFDRRLERRLEM